MQKIIFFDLEFSGHHPSYIHYLSSYFNRKKISANLTFIVSPELLVRHKELISFEYDLENSSLRFLPLDHIEYESLCTRDNAFLSMKRAWQEWSLLAKYAKQISANHCLLLYLDRTHFPIIIRRRLPCYFSSIYFRPSFHYSNFKSHRFSLSEQLQSLREKIQITFDLKHPQAHTLFCLDPFAVDHINRLTTKKKSVFLPDPVPSSFNHSQNLDALQKKLGIKSSRKIFLLFGALSKRKGIFEVLESLGHLSDCQLSQLCILLIGKVNSADEDAFYERLSKLKDLKELQIILNNDLVSEDEVPLYFQLSDVVFATYQKHVGMSGILVRAAAAGKLVISTDYGLMGQVTRCYELGLTVDAQSPDQIAKAISQSLGNCQNQLGKLERMKEFAQSNSVENFADTIFSKILN